MIEVICKQCSAKFNAYPHEVKAGEGKYCSKKCFYKSQIGRHLSEEHKRKIGRSGIGKKHFWKGDSVGYSGLHIWVYRHKGKPKVCDHCGKIGEMINGKWNIHWSNIDHMYRRNLDDFISLCYPCHGKYDKEHGNFKRSKRLQNIIFNRNRK